MHGTRPCPYSPSASSSVAKLAVLASGNGSNFEAVAEAVNRSRHDISCLLSDNPEAFALSRARRFGIPALVVPYANRSREEAEEEILRVLDNYRVDFIALAGFMRLLTPRLLDAYPESIVNIHPSLLPKYPGTRAIQDSYASGDRELGITIHYVDYGLDTGPVILQKSFCRDGRESLEEMEARIHALEHRYYPETLIRIMDAREEKGDGL